MTEQTPLSDVKAAMIGLSGPVLDPSEASLIRTARPAGIILFARNCETRPQLRRLCADIRDAAGWRIPILIDQEGGRVSRLKPPVWPAFPPASLFGDHFEVRPEQAMAACLANARLLGVVCRDVGITVNCAPVLDIPVDEADPIIGDRAFSRNVETLISLARAQCDGFREAGIAPVIKHVPGHGRATADSHLALPIVDTDQHTLEDIDFRPFRAFTDMPIAMTAHVAYRALDGECPASTSANIVRDIIRGHIGFDGLLVSDDLSMQALSGSIEARALACLDAGCDIALHCNGDGDESRRVLDAAPCLDASGQERLKRACQWDVNCDMLGSIEELTRARDHCLEQMTAGSPR